MRILVISGAFPPKPLAEANHTFYVCQHLAQHGADVCVLTTRGAVTEGLRFNVNPIMRDWSWADVPRFVRFLRRCSPDAVLMIYIGFIYNNHPMATFAPTICRWALPGVPFVTQFEHAMGAAPDQCSVWARLMRKLAQHWASAEGVDYKFGTLLRDSDTIIVLSGQHGSKLAKVYPPTVQKCVLIPPPPIVKVKDDGDGVQRKAGRELLKVDGNEFILIYFGYIYSNKGLETLLRAFRLVKERRHGARPVIAARSGFPGTARSSVR